MSKTKILKTILIVLIIVLISMISFGGIFAKNKGSIENQIPEYLLAKDLKGYRRVEIKVSSEEEKSEEDYKLSKEIIEKRLEKMNMTDYEIRQNLEDGSLVLELPENDDTDRVIGNIILQGKFEIQDNDTKEVLMTNDDIEFAEGGYGTKSSGETGVFINFQFNKEGTEKFKEITKKYVGATETIEGEDSTTEITNKIVLLIDEETILTTYFEQEITNGIMQLTLSSSSSSTKEELKELYLEANSVASVIDSGKLPVEYELDQNKFIFSDITNSEINIFVIITSVVVAVLIVFLVVKYKKNGILAGIAFIGYIAALLLVIRYANVEVSIPGLVAIVFSIILNYFVTYSIAGKLNTLESLKKFSLLYIPVLIVSVVFTLANITMGAVLFWGIVLIFLYNLAITKFLIK